MPLWKIFHTPGTFTDATSKQALSKDITAWYVGRTGMPDFYVGVLFMPLGGDQLFVGGKARGAQSPFVRIEVDQIYIRQPNEDEAYKRNIQGVCRTIEPHLEGISWEIHIDETERRLWAMDGYLPPPWKSEEEDRWRDAGRPLASL